MTHDYRLMSSTDDRVALATLALAQASLPMPDWPDLSRMDRCPSQEDSFVLDLPIGGGFVAPLEVGLHHSSRKARNMEATLLAESVREHLTTANIIIARLNRIGRVAEALAAAARARGAPIRIESVGIEQQTSAWGFPMGREEIVVTYPDEQMRPQARTFIIGKLKHFRDEVAELAETAAFRARVAAARDRMGAVAFLDPIAHDAITAFGLDPLAVLQQLLDCPYAASGMNGADFHPRWLRSTVHCRFTAGPKAQWWVDKLSLRKELPATVIAAASGRRLCELISHPIFERAVVAEATSHDWGVEFRIEPLVPLLLMPDGSVTEIDPAEREVVLALLAGAPAKPAL